MYNSRSCKSIIPIDNIINNFIICVKEGPANRGFENELSTAAVSLQPSDLLLLVVDSGHC